MSSIVFLWDRIPSIVKAVLTGLLIAAMGTTPWALLVSLNLKYGSVLPWTVPVMAVYLWFYWRYLQGAWWPKSTTEIRKTNCRANPLSDKAWGAALFAGISGLVFIVSFQAVLSRMIRLPTQPIQDLSRIPALTVFFFVIMSGVVAGVAEEVAFRGYMQRPIEKKHGPLMAILVVGVVFGFAHFTHPEVSLILIPYYLVVSAVYGMLAYFTNSIVPSLVLHAGGNIFSSLGLFMTGNTETQTLARPVPLIWETGTDLKFWLTCGAALIIGAFTVWAYNMLATVVRKIQL